MTEVDPALDESGGSRYHPLVPWPLHGLPQSIPQHVRMRSSLVFKGLVPSILAVGVGSALADTIVFEEFLGVADSISDFAVEFPGGEAVGINDWSYGYYNATTNGTAPGDYTTGLFTPFVTGQTRGAGYGQAASGAPWTNVGPNNAGHPNGTNSAPNEEIWAIRRYTVPAGGLPAGTDLQYTLGGNGSGTGTTMHLFQNGTLLDSITTAAGPEVRNIPSVAANPGDTFDFVLTPEGTDGSRADGSDGSTFGGSFGATIQRTYETVSVLADSVADFSGVQGENGWSYGRYQQTSNPGVFQEFPVDYWDGSKWDVPNGNPPWTEISAESGHPNGDNNAEIEWATRRYTVEEGGDLLVEWTLAKANTGGGSGTSLHVLLNGTEIDFASVGGGDGVGVRRDVVIPGAQPGDIIDFALSPEGLDGSNADGSDGSFFGAKIHVLVPEPATGVLALLGSCLFLVRRRR